MLCFHFRIKETLKEMGISAIGDVINIMSYIQSQKQVGLNSENQKFILIHNFVLNCSNIGISFI